MYNQCIICVLQEYYRCSINSTLQEFIQYTVEVNSAVALLTVNAGLILYCRNLLGDLSLHQMIVVNQFHITGVYLAGKMCVLFCRSEFCSTVHSMLGLFYTAADDSVH